MPNYSATSSVTSSVSVVCSLEVDEVMFVLPATLAVLPFEQAQNTVRHKIIDIKTHKYLRIKNPPSLRTEEKIQ